MGNVLLLIMQLYVVCSWIKSKQGSMHTQANSLKFLLGDLRPPSPFSDSVFPVSLLPFFLLVLCASFLLFSLTELLPCLFSLPFFSIPGLYWFPQHSLFVFSLRQENSPTKNVFKIIDC